MGSSSRRRTGFSYDVGNDKWSRLQGLTGTEPPAQRLFILYIFFAICHVRVKRGIIPQKNRSAISCQQYYKNFVFAGGYRDHGRRYELRRKHVFHFALKLKTKAAFSLYRAGV